MVDESDAPNARSTLLGIGAVLLITCAMVVFLRARPKEDTVTVALAATGAGPAGLEAEAVYDPDTGELKVKLVGFRPPADKDYELWMLRGDQPAKSLGLVSRLAMAKVNARGATGFAISLEPTGGAKPKGGPPTGPVVCAGTLP